MQASERDIEVAEAAVEHERDRQVRRIREDLELSGETHCRECGDPIDVARRLALPSAKRCVDCQQAHEKMRKYLVR